METTPMGGDGDASMVGSESTTRTVEPLLDGCAVITVMDQNSLTETKVVRPILWGHMKVSFWDMVMDGIAIDAHDGSIDDLKVEVIDADVTIENEEAIIDSVARNPHSGSDVDSLYGPWMQAQSRKLCGMQQRKSMLALSKGNKENIMSSSPIKSAMIASKDKVGSKVPQAKKNVMKQQKDIHVNVADVHEHLNNDNELVDGAPLKV
ncbi:hypothetical protein V6N12_049350 [Hibiscus sabdariffa]|uniref:Uncharacterized protein n=1 Tax=Hibiscus sabdariffa TaxID=183260 RepID=A0ABR2CBX2_9ROSI